MNINLKYTNLKNVILTVLLSVMMFSCSKDDDLSNNYITIYDEGDIEITLISIRDQRCPMNVDCVWEGNAEVGFKITKGIETHFFGLNTHSFPPIGIYTLPTSISVFDLEIELLNVQPLPIEGITYSLEDYTITINVIN